MMILKRHINIDNQTYTISILQVWYKALVKNEYSSFGDKSVAIWKIKPSFSQIMYLCNICRGLIWIIFLFVDASLIEYMPWSIQNVGLLAVILNIFLIIGPIILFEIVVAYLTPLEIKNIDSKNNVS